MGHGKQQPGGINRIRNHIENYGDPYVSQAGTEETTVCSACESIYVDQRWYLKQQMDPERLRNRPVHFTVCPACRKIHDKSPGGIVHISGGFLGEHREDILNLVRNEGDRAMAINPLERIMDIEARDSILDVLTTNEKLAQRLGRALHKAYAGAVKYKWSEDNKLARVFWHRD
jgi:NMD protein affecting ribosome stability and mRNA decay